jgi:ribosomal protein L7/L12
MVSMTDIDKELNEIKARLSKLESQITFLHRSLGIESQELPKIIPSTQVINLLNKGDKVGAIRAFREETGAGLKDAKMYIESIQQ